MRTFRFIIALGVLLAILTPAASYASGTLTTPYWCGWGWSSYPCSYNYGSGDGYGSYGYGYNPYQQYPYSYYPYSPYSYNYGYPYYGYSYPVPTCSISATQMSGTYYVYYQRPVQLTWSSSNAHSAYIYPDVGAVSTSGTLTLYPSGNTTYTMTVTGPSGSNTCQASFYGANYYQWNWNYYQQYPYNYYYGYPYNYYGY